MSGSGDKHQDTQLPKLHDLSSFNNRMLLFANALLMQLLPIYVFSEMKGLGVLSSMMFVLPIYCLCSIAYEYLLSRQVLSKYKSLAQKLPKSGSGSGSSKERSKSVEAMSLYFSIAALNATYILSFLFFAYGLASPLPKLYSYLASTSLPLAILFYLYQPQSF